jgi:hypothetical protein
MKRVITIVLAALLTLPAFTQEFSKKEQKQLKKEQKAEEAARKAKVLEAMVHHQRFVLEANTLKNKQGKIFNVSSKVNFIAADSLTGAVQVGTYSYGSYSYIRRNGVGGITVDGTIANYKFTKHEKSGSYYITYNLTTPVGSYEVRLKAYPDGRANADVRSDAPLTTYPDRRMKIFYSRPTWGDKITYSGYLVPIGISRVFLGASL